MNLDRDRNLPVPVSPASPKGARGPARPDARAAAQLLGQDGRRRGLRGGEEVLKAARSAYLDAEYSGEHDRRPESGLIVKADI